MCTVTIEYNENRKAIDLLLSAIKELGAVVTVSKDDDIKYNPEIMEKVQRGMEEHRQGKCVKIPIEQLWN